MTKSKIEAVVKGNGSKSQKMIVLYNEGLEIKEIAAIMGTRYNFVYNVVSNKCRIDGVELRTQKRGDGSSKKDQVIAMLKEGKTCTEISAELKTNVNYVYKVRKEIGA